MRALTESNGTLLLPRKDQSNGAGPKWSNSAGHSTLEATPVGLVGGMSLKQERPPRLSGLLSSLEPGKKRAPSVVSENAPLF